MYTDDYMKYLGFSDFEFKIRLIRLGFSFQKHLYLNSQPTDNQSAIITITLKS